MPRRTSYSTQSATAALVVAIPDVSEESASQYADSNSESRTGEARAVIGKTRLPETRDGQWHLLVNALAIAVACILIVTLVLVPPPISILDRLPSAYSDLGFVVLGALAAFEILYGGIGYYRATKTYFGSQKTPLTSD